MRINRRKKANRYLKFYSLNFGFRTPYQVLLDGTFCQEALKSKVNIQDQLPKYFQDEVRIVTTQCAILETEKLGPAVYGAMLVIKQFHVHKCGHEGKPVSAYSCLMSMIGKANPNRYIIATQDPDLQKMMIRCSGVPVLYIVNKAPTLMKPSFASYQFVSKKNKSTLTDNERHALEAMKNQLLSNKPIIKPARSFHKKKRAQGPNPLSCKKKKKLQQVKQK